MIAPHTLANFQSLTKLIALIINHIVGAIGKSPSQNTKKETTRRQSLFMFALYLLFYFIAFVAIMVFMH